jgi:signal transduction histidine kinase
LIDWARFEEAEHVEDIGFNITTRKTDLGQGTDVEIEFVSKDFTRGSVNKLARSLLLLSDPFREALGDAQKSAPKRKSSDPGFKAELLSQEFTDLQEKVSRAYFSDAEYRVSAHLDEAGRGTFKILDWKGEALHADAAPSQYSAPSLDFDLWVFVLDAKSFSTRGSTVSEVREWLRHVGGVHIYEDSIRVPPYGGPGDDWLELNLRRVRSPEVRPSTNTSIGRVRFSNADGRLAQKTDRIGYIENESFDEMRRFCGDALDWAARILVRERDQKRRSEKQVATEAATKSLTKLEAVLTKAVPEPERKQVEKAIASYVKDTGREAQHLREELQLYRSLATAGMTSAVFAHEIGRPLSLIDQAITALRRLIPEEKKAEADQRTARIASAKQRLNSFVSIPLTMLAKRKRRAGKVDVNACSQEIDRMLRPILEYFKVRTDLSLTEDKADINGSEALIDGILLNLIMNSLTAFQRVGFPAVERTIKVATDRDDASVILSVEDNAGGIDGLEVKDIWLPGVTTSPEGTGFGLTIVRDSVADLAGTIDVEPKTEFGGAKFTARFPAMRGS